jgi:hypothetical protein
MPIHRAASGVPFHDVLQVSFGHENGAHLLTSVGLLLGTMYYTDTVMNFNVAGATTMAAHKTNLPNSINCVHKFTDGPIAQVHTHTH